MAHEIQVHRGERYWRRYQSSLNGAAWDQTGRTLTFELWSDWHNSRGLVLAFDSDDPAGRLVVEPQVGDNVGKWTIDIPDADLDLEPGMYRYLVWSRADADPDDSKLLVPPSDFFVMVSGE